MWVDTKLLEILAMNALRVLWMLNCFLVSAFQLVRRRHYRYLDEGHTICTETLLSPDASPDEPHFDTAEG
jgi:hypothetical protein